MESTKAGEWRFNRKSFDGICSLLQRALTGFNSGSPPPLYLQLKSASGESGLNVIFNIPTTDI